ncbi:hypothetical protein [Amycolatopsis sp. NPDC003731]
MATAATGAEAIEAVLEHRPDVLVLDVALTGALRAGVRGYLPAHTGPADVTRAIRNVAAGAVVFGDGLADRIPRLLLSPAPLPDRRAASPTR